MSEILEFKSLGWLKGVDGSTLVGVKGVWGKQRFAVANGNPGTWQAQPHICLVS
jgi:hypothetical protein